MPSNRVTESTLPLSPFQVVGQDGAESGFIVHAGLAESAGLQNAAKIPVLDMGPPLPGTSRHMRGDVVGSTVLTDDDVQKIRTFVDRHLNEHAAFSHFRMSELLLSVPQMYCVLPHSSPLYENDGRYVRTRFSCVGFVLEAYKTARIRLLNLNGLPLVDMAVIAAVYPQTKLIERGIISAESLGLHGTGPWPVVLCGYLFHSLNREANVIRQEAYTPDLADRHFN